MPQKVFEEIVVPADSVLGLQLETTLDSGQAHIEDRVDARVARDVRSGNNIVIPSGSRVVGSIVEVERGGKIKGRARIGFRFNTLYLSDSSHVSLSTETIYREGESPTSGSVAKIGGAAVGGAILGAIIGGGRGAAIGGAAGAAGGTAAVAMAGDRSQVVIPAGTVVTARLLAPVTITIER